MCELILALRPELNTTNELNEAFNASCSSNQLDIVKYFVSLGANDLAGGFERALDGMCMNVVNYLKNMVTIPWDKILSNYSSAKRIPKERFADFLAFIAEGIRIQKVICPNLLIMIYQNEYTHTKGSVGTREILSQVVLPVETAHGLAVVAIENEDIGMVEYLLSCKAFSTVVKNELRKSNKSLTLPKMKTDNKRKRN